MKLENYHLKEKWKMKLIKNYLRREELLGSLLASNSTNFIRELNDEFCDDNSIRMTTIVFDD